MAIVTLDKVKKNYMLGTTQVPAVRGVSFEIEKGDFISIAGPSGSGKSTILNMIGCMDTPSEGKVVVNGKDISQLTDYQTTMLRHETIGFIFQSFNLIPVLNVFENIEFPLLLGKGGNRTADKKKADKEWVEYLIAQVGLERWIHHKSNELSGGQRQRVAIARALVTKPTIVLADEPTANLDSKTGEEVIELMKKINQDMDTTFIFSTHDATVVGIADHVIRLKDGLITENFRKGA
ncbi:MAG: ABC transporter ATP-binding protein [Spirochaetia bacterium]|jgi:putative ABC transport system ATP-binding protein|nr:ABC transporter ATP-binding protein [Spirochaetales bacterium]MDX9783912.1 ABC transporter ATP-binding protein [Spirochaetia bacterium]